MSGLKKVASATAANATPMAAAKPSLMYIGWHQKQDAATDGRPATFRRLPAGHMSMAQGTWGAQTPSDMHHKIALWRHEFLDRKVFLGSR
jgi:hypothetical protein